MKFDYCVIFIVCSEVFTFSFPQVFHSLLKAHTMEARAIVRQAMAILTPAVPARMEDGHQMLTHWTRKIIVEEGHTVPQLVHILHLIVQHFRVRRSKRRRAMALNGPCQNFKLITANANEFCNLQCQAVCLQPGIGD